MPKKNTAASRLTALFDIRLSNAEHDVLVVKGNELEAASTLIAGRILLSVNDLLVVRKLALRMYATLRLNWTEPVSSKNTTPRVHKYDKKIFEHHWDATKLGACLAESAELSPEQSVESLRGPRRNKSSSSLLLSSPSGSFSNLTSLNSARRSNTVPTGNYEVPFSAVLPGLMPESVEGLPGGSIVYKLEATIDRGKFHQPLVAKKHIRVVRTLTTDAVELSETVAVDNTWPNKVEYSLNVPSKAIAIGLGTQVSLMMVPLLKGLGLGDIRILLVEHYSYVGLVPPVHTAERIVAENFIPSPTEETAEFQMDRWEVDSFVRVPASLSKCTQDCEVQNYLKVRHKLKFVIGLVNPDGHVSELRASLPVQLFILPFISVRAKPDELDYDGSDDEELFSTERSSCSSLADLAHAGNGSHDNSSTSLTGLMAPPLYEKHIYDRLWSDMLPVESPASSGSVTPHAQGDANIGQFSMSPLDAVLLNENLRLLSLQRQNDEDPRRTQLAAGTPGGRATFNLGDSNTESDYFSRGRPVPVRSASHNSQISSLFQNTPLVSPGALSPPTHLSRVGSSASFLDTKNLSKVPSYSQAIKSDANENVFSPAYEPPLPGSQIEVGLLGLSNLGGSGVHLLGSSPTHNYISVPQPSRAPIATRSSGFSVVMPMLPSPGLAHPGLSPPNSVAQPSSSASSRSAVAGTHAKSSSSLNLHNLQFLQKKKK